MEGAIKKTDSHVSTSFVAVENHTPINYRIDPYPVSYSFINNTY